MKLNELKNKQVIRTMPLGKNTITFDHLEYRCDEQDNITGAWIHNTEFRPLFIPIFEEENYQLDLLTEQLGVESYDPDEINKAKGKTIIAHKYTRFDELRQQEFTNVSFNPRYEANKNTTNIIHNYA